MLWKQIWNPPRFLERQFYERIATWITLDSFFQEVEDQVKNAGSIFEFSAKDIDGNVVSFEKYRLGTCDLKISVVFSKFL